VNQASANAAVPIKERVDRLELGVGDRRLDDGRQVFAASASGGPLSPGNDSTGYETGLRHLF